ncbi:MAG TPA: RDD family protein [Stellaceae bacterium]|nr:RDD family protein [Stellaceae bacterium]
MSSTAYSGTTLYAGFWRRVIAVIIDGIVVDVAGGIVLAALAAVVGSPETDDGAIRPVFILVALLFVVGVWLYWTLMESGPAQATLGKQALSIKVTDHDGNRLGFGRANGRFFAKIISYMVPFGVAFMMAGWTAKKQALHDMIAGTLVIRSL